MSKFDATIIGPVEAFHNSVITQLAQKGDPDQFEVGDLIAEYGDRILNSAAIVDLFLDDNGHLLTHQASGARVDFYANYPTADEFRSRMEDVRHLMPESTPQDVFMLKLLDDHYSIIQGIHNLYGIHHYYLDEHALFDQVLGEALSDRREHIPLIIHWSCESHDFPAALMMRAMGTIVNEIPNACLKNPELAAIMISAVDYCVDHATLDKFHALTDIGMPHWIDGWKEQSENGYCLLQKPLPISIATP